jgi:hypothetical protein
LPLATLSDRAGVGSTETRNEPRALRATDFQLSRAGRNHPSRRLRAGHRKAQEAVLLLLGNIVGAPTRASDVFAALLDSPDAEVWYSVVTRRVPAGELVQTLGRLKAGMSAAIPAASLRPWVPVVAQYSFNTARMASVE